MKIRLTDENFQPIDADKGHFSEWMDLWCDINHVAGMHEYREAKQAYIRYLKELRRKSLEEESKRWRVTL